MRNSYMKGMPLNIAADFPAGPGPFPTLIMAPGLRYDMQGSVIKHIAACLVAKGFVVFRFNWDFYENDPQLGLPSCDLSAEIETMHAALNLARRDQRVDQQRLSVAGKSFGSMIAWRVFLTDTSLQRCVLLTPLCTASESERDALRQVNDNYPDASTNARPVLMVAANRDPHCDLPLLYRFATLASAQVAVLTGDHSFETIASNPENAQMRFDRNLNLLVRHMENFLLD